MANHQRHFFVGAAAVPAVLNVARLFMLYGALTVVVATMGSPTAVVVAGQAMLGLGLWLLGVCLLAFVPILMIAGGGGRFPRLALIVAAVADAVLRGFNLQLYLLLSPEEDAV